ncbi:MAG TPA: HEAT repeat domain-containing protein [Coriobacteriia bacterium]|jgi:hypothetical protein
MARPDNIRAEEVVRGLATAANAVRLYPATSPLRDQAVGRFLALAHATVSDGTPLQLIVEPSGFKSGETVLADGQNNVVAFAEALYAHQVGKLIVAPGVTADEVMRFLAAVSADTHAVRDSGGLRAVLKESGVSRLAVVEVTLRASTDEGLSGLDLTAAPLEEIAPRVAAAASAWQESAAQGAGNDGVAGAVAALEEAARDLAMQRIAEALMRLDEATRVKALAAAYATDADGEPMRGMLDVLAKMKPSALARLLSLAANMTGTPTNELLCGLKLPPEALRAVMLLLRPSPQQESARGVPVDADVTAIAREVKAENEVEASELERQIARSPRALAAGKALTTTVQLAMDRKTQDAVQAVGEALAPAVRAGALAEVRAALAFLGTLDRDPALGGAASHARQSVADPELLRLCIGSLSIGADADTVAAILSAAGPVAADTFIAFYIGSNDSLRPRLQQVLRSMGDVVTSAASRRIRDADTPTARELIDVLVGIGDKRTVPVLRQALEHLDVEVRRATLEALARIGGTESERLLVGALGHWDPETRRYAARAIGQARAASAVPAMLKILQGYYLFERNYGLKKELIESLEVLGSPAAVPTLRRMAGRRFVIGRKNRELRYLARRALAGLEQARGNEGRKS